MNVNLDKVDPTRVVADLKRLGLKAGKTTEAQVEALVSYYRDQKKMALAQCDTCGAVSDAELDACPFCGDDGDVEGAEAANTSAAPATPPKKPAEKKPAKKKPGKKKPGKKTIDEVLDEAPESDEPETPEEAAAVEEAKAEVAAGNTMSSDDVKASLDECVACEGSGKSTKGKDCGPCKGTGKKGGAPPKKPKTKPKAAAPEAGGPTGAKKRPARKKKSTKAEVVVADKAEVVHTVEELDEACDTIRKGTRMAARELWEMGQAFSRIDELKLWKLRVDDKGKPVYVGFKQFCAEEFGISPTYAYTLMKVTANYTEADIERLGVAKLKLALSVPDEKRDEMISKAENGATVNDLKSEARRVRENGGTVSASKPPESSALTLAMLPGPQIVEMFKRPTGNTKTHVPAESLQDDPWCMLSLQNDVKLYIRITQTDTGAISAVVEAKRG